MAGKRTRGFQENLKEHIRRSINNPETKGTEKLKWVLAGIKMLALEKMTGTADHGSGFLNIDGGGADDDGDGE